MDLHEFVDSFLEFEEAENYWDTKIEGEYLWKYIRTVTFRKVASYVVGEKIEAAVFNYTPYERRKSLRMLYDYYIRRNAILVRKRDVLIASMYRKVLDENDCYRDIYTYWLDKSLSCSHYILDRNTRRGYYIQQSKNIVNYDIVQFRRFFHVGLKQHYPDKEIVYRLLLEPIEKWFKFKFSVEDLQWAMREVQYRLNNKPIFVKYYKFLLNRIKPKLVMAVDANSFSYQILFEIAKDRGIPTIELEHGMIGPNYINYNYLCKRNHSYFPDYVFVFGKYDKENARWPIPQENVIPTGFPELEMMKIRYQSYKSEQINIVFVSNLSRETHLYAIELSKRLDSKKYRVICKLHPAEIPKYYFELEKLYMNSNVEVAKKSEDSVYKYLGMADWCVGVDSTAIFEATQFDTKIAILNTASDSASVLCKTKKAILINSVDELESAITNNTFVPDKTYTFFEENSIYKMTKAVDTIMNQME